ncbi:hypothetical protein AXF42_Ash021583 [Apostasia shenzhenica]|uniref:Uncharacterized protein n=1 Tax=Apostasia shenzhenica TaxID=1088818 RepID=A0A2H9ZYB1_9ASPA|nr:hypothetical protein AXF42_Ash021583 [Apostasia shenzhenica]
MRLPERRQYELAQVDRTGYYLSSRNHTQDLQCRGDPQEDNIIHLQSLTSHTMLWGISIPSKIRHKDSRYCLPLNFGHDA